MSPSAYVLVVDDDEMVRELTVSVLERAGYAVLSAEHGRAALALLDTRPIDLMVTDLRMPVMDGSALIRESRKRFPDVDVIVLTAHGSVESAVEALKLGALDYLGKPFNVLELCDRVDRCFALRREREESLRAPTLPLVDLARIINRSAELIEMLEAVISLMRETFDAHRLRLVFYNGWARPDLTEHLSDHCVAGAPDDSPSPEEIKALAREAAPWLFGEADLCSWDPGLNRGFGLLVPLETGGQVLGAVQLWRERHTRRYTESDAQLLHLFGAQIALAVLQADTYQRLRETFSDFQELSLSAATALVEALGTFDEYTRGHSRRVAGYARLMCQALDIDARQSEIIEIAGLLHDIGKLGVGDTTIRKNGKLTEAEREKINLHPAQGARILSSMESLAAIVPMVRHHHEHYDGTGYPDGLVGRQVPMGARLLAVVDAYDSMTSDRPYRRALGHGEAMARLMAGRGTHFCPLMVDTWLGIAGKSVPAIQTVEGVLS